MTEPKQWVKEDPEKEDVFWPTEKMKEKAWVSDESIYEEALEDPQGFWAKHAEEGIDWYEKWDEVYTEEPYDYEWFVGGKLNLCYNAIDRHVENGKGDEEAIIWEPEPTDQETVRLTYSELLEEVSKFANVLEGFGVEKGDRVGIYMPMIPEALIAMLATARVGAAHSVVFSAFSPDSLKDRLEDANAKVLVTADGYYRRGKPLNLKKNANKGLQGSPVENVVTVKRTGKDVEMHEGRDHWYHELMEDADPEHEPAVMNSSDLAFILYTSGTTGKPKGVMHHVGGYAVQAYLTAKWNFNLNDDDIFWCTADVGWITGHTYINYGPLLNGVTTVVYEGAPDYPEYDRLWEIVEDEGVTGFYTAPTAIRMFIKQGTKWPDKHDLSSLRVLGTVGEPINKDAWMWYFENIGGGRCPVVDTWWQTETGANVINALPGIGPFIPTYAGKPFPGIDAELLDTEGNPVGVDEGGYLTIRSPFPPSLIRGVYKRPEKFKEEYWSEYGPEYYFTSDGARKDEDGNIRITGRLDDVMNVAGHRLATGEVENALGKHESVAEPAVVSRPDEVKGEVPVAFVMLEKGADIDEETLQEELIQLVDDTIGPTARPADIIIADEVPKTRSGKIMRRILKSLVRGEDVGDLTTLRNPETVEELQEKLSE
ncbi:MAG: acetate--CoA ligase [Candidatus Bipolaricaulota bacterium]|nr:acetate--CoA ligase [Candidatus Bipolaricaulota bacterium]MBS3791116.1 acetate--CoA ligase [Candidatus Bipolaricaulota bacterium]